MRIRLYLAAALALRLSGGWALSAGAEGVENGDLIARIHFAGTTQIAADPNAAKLNEIFNLPENEPLREEVFAKLATTPFRVMNRNSPVRNNDNAALMRPLVEDVFKSETYLEMRGPTNAWPEMMLAVKLDKARAEVWRANLAKTLTDWTGIAVKDVEIEGFKGWELKKHHYPNVFRFIRAGNWVVFGWGQDELTLQSAILKKIKDTKRPVTTLKKSWLEAWMDWPAFAAYHPIPFQLPKMELAVEGRKDFLRPELKLHFAEPLGLSLEPWRIPTNTIFDPVDSITMARGFGPLLGRIAAISKLNAEPLPNQAVMWALPQLPFLTCAAIPVMDSTNYLQKIAPGLMSLINSNLAEQKLPGITVMTTNGSLALRGFSMLAPFLRATNEVTGDYLFGGIFATPPQMKPFPWQPLLAAVAPDNVIYYDWEMNGERLFQWRALSQLRYIARRTSVPGVDTPAQNWLMAVKPKLESCATVGTLTGPDEIKVVRNSALGMTGFELTYLAIWLDSPGFPLKENVNAVTPANAGHTVPQGK